MPVGHAMARMEQEQTTLNRFAGIPVNELGDLSVLVELVLKGNQNQCHHADISLEREQIHE
eukprot:2303007-Lingulodinium_polyedra.AAC.1